MASQLDTLGTDLLLSIDRVLIGNHPTIVKLRTAIGRVAATDATVLITGESGTGKELVANAINSMSSRRTRAFVPVNCAAIPQDLLESEMFGHERGAFTGAMGPRHGLFGVANGGTIFLDEIGEMPPTLQAKMLRVLEDGMVRAVGSDRAMHVDVRVIAATNIDLLRSVERNKFREDLYYRLNVVPVTIPPVRERRSDIPLLIEHFIARIRARPPGREISISRDAMVALWSYDWPGNVRELENLLERLSIMNDGATIELAALPERLVSGARPASPQIPSVLGEDGLDLNKLVRDLEGRLINEALKRTLGNKQAAARLLGLKRTTFAAKLRRCGVIASGADDERE